MTKTRKKVGDFDQILTIFKSMKWCQSVQKSRFSRNRVYTLFKPKFDGESDAELKKMIGAREKCVLSTF